MFSVLFLTHTLSLSVSALLCCYVAVEVAVVVAMNEFKTLFFAMLSYGSELNELPTLRSIYIHDVSLGNVYLNWTLSSSSLVGVVFSSSLSLSLPLLFAYIVKIFAAVLFDSFFYVVAFSIVVFKDIVV